MTGCVSSLVNEVLSELVSRYRPIICGLGAAPAAGEIPTGRGKTRVRVLLFASRGAGRQPGGPWQPSTERFHVPLTGC